MAAKSILQEVLDLAGKFVSAQKGQWGHDEWEQLLADVAALGLELTDETKRNLGNIVESCKHFHAMKAAPVKAVPAKKKTAVKKAK